MLMKTNWPEFIFTIRRKEVYSMGRIVGLTFMEPTATEAEADKDKKSEEVLQDESKESAEADKDKKK